MEYEVVFPGGFKALNGARRCRLRRLSSEAKAVLLESLEDARGILVLGDVFLLSPGFSLALSHEERAALGRAEGAGDKGIAVFCRLSVPSEYPLAAGFDLSQLVLVDTATGRGLCVSRPLQPLVSLKDKDPGA
ncbi:hypothetical protein [Mailhella massiliensis]|uniref:Uncharacterized protein n=1 Tax=Mailhella massiliensis TaxID=1903261 RepID=A0A921DRV4_9BACT|nr:hypothetical protein [Mailhella massiliensis]HJD97473.1 hypothetical protein [Mailhella massiliensis]